MRVLKVSVYLQAMKNIFYTIICCLISLTSLAQSDFGYGNPDGMDPQDEGMQRDSTKEQRYVPHYRLTWKWVHDGVYQKFYQLDTLQDGLQNTNLIFKHSVSNTYLGNFPAPYVSDIYILRPQGEDFLPQDRLRDYFFKPEDALEYNTTAPFTQLSYFNGGGRGKTEDWLMITLEDECRMWFRGEKGRPMAIVEVKVLGKEIDSAASEKMTKAVCGLFQEQLGVDPEDIYIRYLASVDWGWNNANF